VLKEKNEKNENINNIDTTISYARTPVFYEENFHAYNNSSRPYMYSSK